MVKNQRDSDLNVDADKAALLTISIELLAQLIRDDNDIKGIIKKISINYSFMQICDYIGQNLHQQYHI